MNLNEINKELDHLDEVVISHEDDKQIDHQVKEKLRELISTGRYNNLRDLKWEFMRRRNNSKLIEMYGKPVLYDMIEKYYYEIEDSK